MVPGTQKIFFLAEALLVMTTFKEILKEICWYASECKSMFNIFTNSPKWDNLPWMSMTKNKIGTIFNITICSYSLSNFIKLFFIFFIPQLESWMLPYQKALLMWLFSHHTDSHTLTSCNGTIEIFARQEMVKFSLFCSTATLIEGQDFSKGIKL